MSDDLFDCQPGEPLTDYAERMFDLMQIAQSCVEFELGRGIPVEVMLDEMREIIDGDGKSLAVRRVREALDSARPYFPRLEIPAYPSDNDLVEAAMELVRQWETDSCGADRR